MTRPIHPLRDLPPLRAERGVNDYAVIAYPPGRAPYTIASNIPNRRVARLLVAAPRLVRALDACVTVLAEEVGHAAPDHPTVQRHARVARTARRLLTSLAKAGV